MASLVLYNYFRSSTSFRARIALNFKGLAYDYKPINLLQSQQRSPEYLKINPLGGVPTLIHNDKTMAESVAIIEYIDEVFANPPLFPKGAFERAKVREICEWINSGLHPLGNLKVTKYLESAAGFDQAKKDQWLNHWWSEGLTALEKILQETAGTYSFGDSITAADVFLVPQVVTCQRFHHDMSAYPTIMRIYKACLQQDAFIKAHPFKQIDTPEEFKGKPLL
jgi:maleylacetoacetate isomerase/maleylpyruvate isomerase